MNIRSGIEKSITKSKKGYYLKKSSIYFVRKSGLSSGMKCPEFGNVIPVTLLFFYFYITYIQFTVLVEILNLMTIPEYISFCK